MPRSRSHSLERPHGPDSSGSSEKRGLDTTFGGSKIGENTNPLRKQANDAKDAKTKGADKSAVEKAGTRVRETQKDNPNQQQQSDAQQDIQSRRELAEAKVRRRGSRRRGRSRDSGRRTQSESRGDYQERRTQGEPTRGRTFERENRGDYQERRTQSEPRGRTFERENRGGDRERRTQSEDSGRRTQSEDSGRRNLLTKEMERREETKKGIWERVLSKIRSDDPTGMQSIVLQNAVGTASKPASQEVDEGDRAALS
jgi:hypothetical protein